MSSLNHHTLLYRKENVKNNEQNLFGDYSCCFVCSFVYQMSVVVLEISKPEITRVRMM